MNCKSMRYTINCQIVPKPTLLLLFSSFIHGNPSSNGLIVREICDSIAGTVGGLDELALALNEFRKNLTSTLVTQVIDNCKSEAPTRRLLRFIIWSKKVLTSEFTDVEFNLSLRAMAERKDHSGMKVLLWDMVKEGRIMKPCTFVAVADALVKVGKADEALGVFKNLEKFQCPRDGESVVAIVTSLCKKGHAKKAQGVLWHHKDKVSMLEMENIFKSILYGWVVKRKLKEARNVLKEMKRTGITPDLFCYNTLLKGLCEKNAARNPSGLVPDALNVLMEMRSYQVEPNTISYNMLLSCLGRVRRIKEACNVLELMKKSGSEPDWISYYHVVKLLYVTGRFGKGSKFVEEMTEMGLVPERKFYFDLIRILCKSARPKLALKLLDMAKATSLGGYESLYDLLISELCREGELEKGRQLWDEAMAEGLTLSYRSDTLDSMD